MLLVCVHATKTVLSEIKGARFSGVSLGLELSGSEEEDSGAHHLMVSCWRSARETQEERFASWSSFDRMISEPAGKERV